MNENNNGFEYEQNTQPTSVKEEKTIAYKRHLATCVMVSLAVAVVIFLLSGVYFGNVYREKYNKDLATNATGSAVFTAEELKIFDEAYELISKQYVDEFNKEDLVLNAFRGFVAGAGDVYTAYMTAEELGGFVDGDYGDKAGVGIRVYMTAEDEGIRIFYVFEDAPAGKAGVKAGDTIIAVDGTKVSYDNYNEVIDMVTGEIGTDVVLTVKRGSETIDFTVTRGKFTVSSVEYRMLDNNIGYVRIDGLASDTAKAFKNAMNDLMKQGAEKYVFDVREDSGGYLSSITSVLDMLLPEGPIARYKYADGSMEQDNSDKDVIVSAPFAVLINENTASAAELFAAALKDYKLATLVGNTTFGKGVMQTLLPLSNGDGVKVTTAYYYPPFSDNYNGVGVKPDIEVSLPDGKAYFMFSEEEDTQLQAAIKALNEINS